MDHWARISSHSYCCRSRIVSGFVLYKIGKGRNKLSEELSGCYLSIREIKDKLEQNAACLTRGRTEMNRNYFFSQQRTLGHVLAYMSL